MQTDVFFLHPTFVSLKLHLSVSNVPIYFYRVSIQSKLNLYKKIAGITNSGKDVNNTNIILIRINLFNMYIFKISSFCFSDNLPC